MEVNCISECSKPGPIHLHLDKFQLDKRARMKFLLNEIEEKKEMPISEFFSYIAINYGIRRPTGEEYLEAWIDGGFIRIENEIIKFVKRPKYSE